MSEQIEDSAPVEQHADVHSVIARQPLRSRLASDVESFLARGGSIEEVPRDYRADPPKRPDTSYGRGSL